MANRIIPKTQTGTQLTATPKHKDMKPKRKVNLEFAFPIVKIGSKITNVRKAKTRKFAAKTSIPRKSATKLGIPEMSIGVFFYLLHFHVIPELQIMKQTSAINPAITATHIKVKLRFLIAPPKPIALTTEPPTKPQKEMIGKASV